MFGVIHMRWIFWIRHFLHRWSGRYVRRRSCWIWHQSTFMTVFLFFSGENIRPLGLALGNSFLSGSFARAGILHQYTCMMYDVPYLLRLFPLGNILTAFPSGFAIQIIKLGFVLSVAVSFPLVVFPCRTSIHSLIFRKVKFSLIYIYTVKECLAN